MAKKLKMIFAYENTEDTRQYDFDVADSVTAACKSNILAINASLKAGNDGGLSDFFVSDEGDSFSLIAAAQLEEINKTVLDLNIENGGGSSVNP